MTKAQAKKYVKNVLAKKSYDTLASSLPDAMYDATTARAVVVPGMTRAAGYYGRYRTGGEAKFFDTNPAVVSASSAGAILVPSFNLVPIGTGPSERIGRRLLITSIGIRLTFKLAPGYASDHVRCLLYEDLQCNGAAPAVTDILYTADVDSYMNLANVDRFRVIRDYHVVLNSQAGATSGGVVTPIGDYKIVGDYRAMKCPIDFSLGAGTTIADVKSRNIGMLLISENNAITNVELHSRIRYTDN